MSHHEDLLDLARSLVLRGRTGRPRQADLRKAISAAYYALFHMLVHEATHRLVPGPGRNGLRLALGRTFVHTDMKAVAGGFFSGNPIAPLKRAMNGTAPTKQLVGVAEAFILLQNARHSADYDLGRRFSREEALIHVQRAEHAFLDWRSIRKTLEADVFLVALLSQRNMRG